MLGVIGEAQRFIYAEDQYLTTVDGEAIGALRKALSRIQHLTIVIPNQSIITDLSLWYRRSQIIQSLKQVGGDRVRVFWRVTPGKDGSATFGRHSYVHSKTWIFDDQLAIIGSANFNRRGWSHDSEVVAAIFDKVDSVLDPSFAQKLRRDLWAEHLGVAPTAVSHGTESAKLWLKLPQTAQVRPYNPAEDKDDSKVEEKAKLGDWDNQVDPSGDGLPNCGESSVVAPCK
jgi:phosphatidylserine/phosphatidylglycerophosphate/cardiolipin synthase-like enzyme